MEPVAPTCSDRGHSPKQPQYCVFMEPRGAYTAERAAALSGVPKSTIHYWARQDILVPSVSAERVKLWSYGDLMALRTIY